MIFYIFKLFSVVAKRQFVETPGLVIFVKVARSWNAVGLRYERRCLHHQVESVVGNEADILGADSAGAR
jgi:hypothetical protein